MGLLAALGAYQVALPQLRRTHKAQGLVDHNLPEGTYGFLFLHIQLNNTKALTTTARNLYFRYYTPRMIPSDAIKKIVAELNLEHPGSITHEDQVFLGTLLLHTAPESVLEIGTAAGVSTVCIAMVIDRLLKRGKITSIDCAAAWYLDQSKEIGFLVKQSDAAARITTVLPETWACDLVLKTEETYDFVFIDADHWHPWPILDTILVSCVTKPGSWIVHHDIRLPYIMPNKREFGAVWLFEAFRGEKLKPDNKDQNIGAIKAESDFLESLIPLLQIGWETAIHQDVIARMDEALKRFSPPLAARLREMVQRYGRKR